MTDKPNRDELIDKYLLGELDETSRADFDQLLTSDQDFRHALEEQTRLFNAIKDTGRLSWKQKLKEFHSDIEKTPVSTPAATKTGIPVEKKTGNYTLRWLTAAAMVLLVAGLWWLNGRKQNTEQLLAMYFKPYPVLSGTIRGQEDSSVNSFNSFTALYEAGNYPACISKFRQIPDSMKTGIAYLYLGNAFFANNMADSATASFRKSISLDPRFRPEAEWYLGLSLLKQGDKKEGVDLLEAIASGNGAYKSKAQSLLESLK